MFKCAIGHSDEIDTADAAAAALKGCEGRLDGAVPGAALIFCGIDYDHAAIIDLVKGRYPGIALVGCTTDGEVSSDLAFAQESVLIVLFASDTVTFRSGIGHGISTAAEKATEAAAQAASRDGETPALVLIVPDGLTACGDTVLRGLQRAFGEHVPIVGGAAGDKRRIKRTLQLHDSGVHHDSVAVLAFFGPMQLAVGVASGWEPLGKRVQVTRSEGRVAYEIDGKSAIDYYRHYMGEYTRTGALPAYPLGVWPKNGEPFYVRSAAIIDEQAGAVVFTGELPEGADVQMMQVDRPNIIHGAEASIAAAMRSFPGARPSAVLMVSCTSRNEMLGTQVGNEAKTIQAGAGSIPMFGFYAYGEYAPTSVGSPTRYHNETCVTLVLGEK